MHFRFLNIPVHISPTFWLFLLFFTEIWRDPSVENLIVGIVFGVSLLIHEYGHALTAGYFGYQSEIHLEAFGGYAEWNSRGAAWWQKFLITLGGPLFECLLIIQSYLLLRWGVFENYYVNYFLYLTYRLNLLWVLLNLIPVAPLDGGQMLRTLLVKQWRYKGYYASIVIGMCSVVVFAPWLYYKGYSFFSILLLVFGFQNFQEWQVERR